LPERTLEPTNGFLIIAAYAETSGAEIDAEVILAIRVAANRASAEPADSGARVATNND
jgi:hypothetical protein